MFSVISGATGASYTPGAADVGMFLRALRASASYSDAFGPGRTASGTAESAVAHSVPVSSAADYPDGAAARSVAENAASGAVVGVVAATDADGDTLTYSVAETTESDAAADLAAFSRDFSIDAASGQISVNAAAMIDFEDRRSYKVLYQVSDSVDDAGDPDNAIDDTVTLTVTVTNVDDVYDAVTAAGVSVEVDDDDDAAVSVSFGSGMYSVSEDGMTASVTVSLSAVPDREVVIPIAVTNQGDTSAGDYTAAPATLTFAAVDDRVDDDGESVVLGFGTLPSGVSAGAPSTATVTIVDNDTAGVSVSAGPVFVGEGVTGTYTVVLDSEPSGDVTVTAVSADAGAVTVSPSVLTFTSTNWDTPQTVTVRAADGIDTDDEKRQPVAQCARPVRPKMGHLVTHGQPPLL